MATVERMKKKIRESEAELESKDKIIAILNEEGTRQRRKSPVNYASLSENAD